MEWRNVWRATSSRWLILAIALIVCSPTWSQQLDRSTLGNLRYRLVGPIRGGRVDAVGGLSGTNTYFFGAVDGGVWKSADAGMTWEPLFDKQPVQSIGAIAFAPSDANIIYVGTGEPCLRGDISYGNGVYKTTDGGTTWTHIGLEDTRHISAIIVDPRDPNLVMVAAIGHAFGPNEQRGIFRSADGGKTWQKVLYDDDKTGGGDLVFDPTNSSIVYAALYQVVRSPWGFDSGGPGSGMYKSTDEGLTWKLLQGNGLPSGVLGKIGIAVGPDGQHVYALIEAEKGGVYGSDDAGGHWALVNDDDRFRQRAWYYSHIYADPKDVNKLYVLNTGVFRSADGGHSWRQVIGGDSHMLWIDPANTAHMIVGSDSGAAVSVDGGETWSTHLNQPTAQFYHVATDNRFPYYLYGALQDSSGSLAIASHGNANDFYGVGGGESGWVVSDASGDTVYAGAAGGVITRFERSSGQTTDVSPWPLNSTGHPAANLKYRFQWTAPIAASPLDAKAIYFGGNALFKTVDAGHTWKVISPDLTRNDKSKQQSAGGSITQDNSGAEVYDVIFVIAPSPLARGQIWVGSDDGLIHLTRDDGLHWQDITPKDLPEWHKVSGIDPSPFDAGTAYVAVNGNKLDDQRPYIYRTADFGKTWTRIHDGIPDGAYVHTVIEDPGHRGLLYAGTELGVYISFNDGAHWQSLRLNMPAVSVRDLRIKGDDLVVATHGRSFWSLDDVSPLRQFTDKVESADVFLFHPAAAYRAQFDYGFDSDHYGVIPLIGATIDYWLKSGPSGDITLDILDSKGMVIRSYSSKINTRAAAPASTDEERQMFGAPGDPISGGFGRTAQATLPKYDGLNRLVWDLRYNPAHAVPGTVASASPGPMAVPGSYTVKLTVGGQSYTAPLVVKLDPRVHATQTDLERQLALSLRIQQVVNSARDSVNQIRSLHEQLEADERRLGPNHGDISDAVKQLDEKAVAIENNLIQTKSKSNEDRLNFPPMLADQMAAFSSSVGKADSAPTEADYTVYNQLKARIDEQLAAWHSLQAKDLISLNDLMKRAGLP
jgi:photosystem II stability/assembly factor-like uncharacterized protein